MNPTAFISYCWDTPGEQNEEWVLQLAQRLRDDGVGVKLDKWDVLPGDHIAPYMQRSIAKSDKVLIICTPNYKIKADDQNGSVGYESNIICAQIWLTADHRKFITILKDGNALDSVPIGLQGKYHIRLNSSGIYEDQYRLLLDCISGKQAGDVQPAKNDTSEKNRAGDPAVKDYNNLSFAVLKQYTREDIRQLIDHYRQRIIGNRADAQAYFGIGLCYLHADLHDLACRQLKKAVSLSPGIADYHYYYALSLVKGTELNSLPGNIIEEISQRLACAIQLDSQQAKYYCFLLLLRHEHCKLENATFSEQHMETELKKSKETYRDEGEIERLASLLNIHNPETLAILFNK